MAFQIELLSIGELRGRSDQRLFDSQLEVSGSSLHLHCVAP